MDQTDPRELLKNIVRIFDRCRIPYLITGGMAVLIWGRPRFTADIDIVVEISPSGVDGLVNALKGLGKSGYIDRDVVRKIVKNGGEFNFIDGMTGVKVDFWISDNGGFDLSRFKRRIGREILGQKIYFTSPEDLILSKLKWYKESGSNRHLEDVESILKISEANLDMKYIKEWVKKLDLLDEFMKVI